MLRDIFGNPFRPAAINPAWLTWNNSTVPKLAQSISDARAFDRLPLLADALAAAGCTNEDILAHCRSGNVTLPPKHARRFSSMLASSKVSKPLLP